MNNENCHLYQPWLAACVEASQTSRPLAQWTRVQAHLISCPDCALEYAWLLYFERLEAASQLPVPVRFPALDTSFLHGSDQK
jgi:hypothetical protein